MAAVATGERNGRFVVDSVQLIQINEPPIPGHIFCQTLNETLGIRLSASTDQEP